MEEKAETVLKIYLETVAPGQPQVHENLALFPLILPEEGPTADFLTLDEALDEKGFRITETNEHGTVPELKVVNALKKNVLILDGEELVGAKQNRIVNTTILVAAGATLIIPVSCVEQGRWSYSSETFGSGGKVMPSRLRSKKAASVSLALKGRRGFVSDQGAIWEDLQGRASRRKAESATMAMGEIYEKDRPFLDAYLKQFHPVDRQAGAAFAISGAMAGIDTFGAYRTLQSLFRKLVESYALDALDDIKRKGAPPPGEEAVRDFIGEAAAAVVECRISAGLGTDCRFETKTITGFALVHGDRVCHLSLFAKSGENHRPGSARSLRRFSGRRNFRA